MADGPKTKDAQTTENAQQALTSPNIPHLYSNGFISGMGNGDCFVVLLQNGRPVATINLSYTVTKSLANTLGSIISDLEKNSGNVIMTTKDLDGVLAKAQGTPVGVD